MCGIAGIYLKDPSIVANDNDRIQFDRFVDSLLLGIEPRGKDATGFVASRGSTITLDKDDKPASDFIKTRKRAWLKNGTRIVLTHARLATQGHQSHHPNNHPVMYGTTFITHNGHIHNDDDVFDELGMPRYDIAVDSVAIAASVEKHGLRENFKDALTNLQGSYAFAAINPKTYPDELVLVKGPSSPIAYFENNYMLVWASTGMAIKEALATILGEDANPKLEYFGEGDVMFVRDGEATMERKWFEPARKSYTTYTTYNWDGWPEGGTTYRRPSASVTTALNLEVQVSLMRKEGKGRAITWDLRDQMTPEQKKLYTGRWATCLHCNDMIASFHLVRHTKHGEMCVDCFAIATSETLRRNYGKGAQWAGMDEHDYKMLVEQAEFDSLTVKETVELAAQRTGMPEELITWLVFYSDFNNLEDATEQLRERAYEVYLDCENYVMAGFIPSSSDSCAAPPSKQIEAPKDYAEPENLPVVMGKCDQCRRKAKIYADGRRWCTQHYTKCRTSRCKDSVVGHNNEGAWCHTHSRGKKGLRYLQKVS